jgi:hypothetical protein
MIYQAQDTKADPFADDLASLGPDVLVAEAGWSRHAPNPLLLVGHNHRRFESATDFPNPLSPVQNSVR